MRSFEDFSIKRKLTIIIVMTSFVGILLSSVSIAVHDLKLFRESMVEKFMSLAEVIGTNSAASLIFQDADAAKETLTALRAEPHVYFAYIYTKEGHIFAKYIRKGTNKGSLLQRSEKETPGDMPPHGIMDGHQFRNGYLKLYKPIVLDGETLGSVFIFSDLEELHSRVKVYTAIVGILALGAILVAYLLSAKLQHVISDPILSLAQKMNDISEEKDYAIRVEKQSHDEVGVLIDGFNEMLAQIQERDSRLEQHRQRLENQVAMRTAELSETNKNLQKEIDERKRTGEALRLSEEKFRSLVELTSDWIWETDPKGVFRFADPTIKEFLGYEPEEILGKTLLDFMPEDETERVSELFSNYIEKEKSFARAEIIQIHKDGRHRVIETSGTPFFDKEGTLKGWRGIDTDITERKEAEEAIEQARMEAEAANKAKSEFLANMSHEIRTPMNGILGMVQILQDTALDADQRESLDIIAKSSNSLLNLINDILDISKIEAGKMEMEEIPFNLRVTLEDIVETIAPRAYQKKLEIACLIEADVPVFLQGDPGRLRQILVNLMGNSIKFTEQGEVTVRVHLEKEGEKAATLRFDVSDTGIGIPHDRIEKIFGAFSQADGSTTRKYGGTGLGLAISKQLVDMLGGQIVVDSTEGQGSTFSFTARFIKDEGARKRTPLTYEYTDLKDMRILIVDDNKTNRLVCAMMLEPYGCRIAAVDSGFAALTALREAGTDNDPIKVVLMDQMMPELSGEQTAKLIKSDPLICDVIIIMLTSFGTRGDLKRLKDIGVRGYLLKPIKQQHLQKAIVTAIGQHAEKLDEITPMITRHTIAEASFDDTVILLAEDHVINQKVATKILQKWGLKVIIAEDGQKAVTAVKTSDFALVLMDVQMPVMDGLAATAKIREMEQETEKHVPIIAMTANAMKGDREKCLEAGMDDFVSKPIVREALYKTLEKWIKFKERETGEASGSGFEKDTSVPEEKNSPTSSEDVFDLSPVLARFDDDMDFFRELAEIFINDTPQQIETLRHSLENKDAKEVENLAHKLKGVSGNFGIEPLYDLFSKLQELGKKGELDQATKVFSEAAVLYQQVETSLKQSFEG